MSSELRETGNWKPLSWFVPITASHSAADNRNRIATPSLSKRIIFAALFAVIATGMTFYVITFLAMYAALGSGKLNPAVAPGVNWSLRDLGVPAAVLAGVLVFGLTMWRGRRRNR